MNRRDFIKVVSTAGSGFVLGFYIPYTNKLNGKTVAPTIFEPNAWIKIKSDNMVQIMVAKSEMGQGVLTSLPMIIAEEMDLDWSKVIVEKAPADQKKYGWQMTGGSNSVSGGYNKLRQAGATARPWKAVPGQEAADCIQQDGELAGVAVRVQTARTMRAVGVGDFSARGRDGG